MRRRIAILAGVNAYSGALPGLDYADDDAQELHALLISPKFGQFDPELSTLLLNPTKQELEECLERVIFALTPDDTFLFYFAGHGLRIGDMLFLAGRDSSPQRPMSSCISVGLIDSLLDATACRGQILLFDCCFAGSAGGPRTRGLITRSLQHLSGQGRVVLGSSGNEETSRETGGLGHGVFTAGLLEGLRTGDADHDADGYISTTDAFRYIYNFVVQRAPQEPIMWGADVRGDLYLSLNPRVRFRQVRHPVDGKRMALVDGGVYLHGRDNEECFVDAFYMDTTPVTNAEYARFVAETGHRPPHHWGGTTCPGGLENHPVVHVTHTDAAAYAAWAGKRLPEESEWEKAARGDKGNIYPWGNQPTVAKCNVRESGIGGTTPVGRYRSGVSAYGIYDLAGNVWEWCATETEPGRYALRGSAFTSPFESAAAYETNDASEQMSDDDTGFRCVVSFDAMDQLLSADATDSQTAELLTALEGAELTAAQWRQAAAQLERLRGGEDKPSAEAALRRLLREEAAADRGTPPPAGAGPRLRASAEVRDLITVIRRSLPQPGPGHSGPRPA